MAKRSRDRRWGEIRALRMQLRERGQVKLRISLDDIPPVLTVEIRDQQGNLLHLSTTQASTEWQTVTEWLAEALHAAIDDLDKEDTNGNGN